MTAREKARTNQRFLPGLSKFCPLLTLNCTVQGNSIILLLELLMALGPLQPLPTSSSYPLWHYIKVTSDYFGFPCEGFIPLQITHQAMKDWDIKARWSFLFIFVLVSVINYYKELACFDEWFLRLPRLAHWHRLILPAWGRKGDSLPPWQCPALLPCPVLLAGNSNHVAFESYVSISPKADYCPHRLPSELNLSLLKYPPK